MEHWLSYRVLDRYVFTAVPSCGACGCSAITAETIRLLTADYKLRASVGQILTEDAVYVSLHRLIQKGWVEKYRDFRSGGIRYRRTRYRR